ncbi:hypothetical protein [Paracoccus endophyticus]|uniref:hypothetical protein n=1 Tax=Paracoccus endophyticus TaxID=2233774 RepID=UPI001F0B8ED2|nr:hypothetical protein [Paracoccus endophyticus]
MALVPRILSTWRAPGATVASLRGMPEPSMLALLIGTMAVYFVAQWPGLARVAQIDPSVPLNARLAGALLATLFLMPLLVLAVAGIVQLVARVLGLRLGGADSRLALIWALAATAPAMLLAGLVGGLIGPGPGLTLVHVVSGLAFVLFWGTGLAALARRPDRRRLS